MMLITCFATHKLILYAFNSCLVTEPNQVCLLPTQLGALKQGQVVGTRRKIYLECSK
jgi:hypothetical protein